jgi:hypothetical protein
MRQDAKSTSSLCRAAATPKGFPITTGWLLPSCGSAFQARPGAVRPRIETLLGVVALL